MAVVTVSSKGQIAIPKAIRDQLNLKAGSELEIDVQGVTLLMRRTVSGYPHWSTMRGMLKGGPSLTKALEEDRAAEVAHDEARVKQHR